MSATWRAVGNFVSLRKSNTKNDLGLITGVEYSVDSVGDTVPITLKVNDRVILTDDATIISLAPSNSTTNLVVNYADIIARRQLQYSYVEEE